VRPLNLRIAGFTCYSDPVEIPFRGMDIFAITGPTGSGKSTIVDAICYALYGRVPRHSETTSLISHNRDSMSVDLEFEAAGKRYRVHRGINQQRKTGRNGRETVTRLPSPVQLEEMDGDEWKPIAGRVADVDHEIERIVGLDYRGFTVCVLLPQGRFQEFLAGEKKDRRQVLTDLLDIGVYEEVMRLANAKANDLSRDISANERRLKEDYGDATPQALEDVRAQMEEARPRLSQAIAQRDALTEAKGLAETVTSARKRQSEREKKREEVLGQVAELQALARDGQQQLAQLREELATVQKALAATVYDPDRQLQLERALQQLRRVSSLAGQLAAADKTAADDSSLRKASATLEKASLDHEAAVRRLAEAQAALDRARDLDSAAHLRARLRPGETCPVCGGKVGEGLAPVEAHVAEAEAALKAAREEEAASSDVARRAERDLANAKAQAEAAAREARRLAKEVEEARDEAARLLPEGVPADASAVQSLLDAEIARGEERRRLAAQESDLRSRTDDLAPQVAASESTLAQLQGHAEALAAEAEQAAGEAEEAKASLVRLAQDWGWGDVSELIKAKQSPADAIAAQLRAANTEIDVLTRRIAGLENDERRIEEGIEKASRLRQEQEELTGRMLRYKELGTLLRADHFQAFVIEEAMAELARAASLHLVRIHPRFALRVEKDEFVVVDSWQAGQARSARTLSGGETFVASLALALALSESMPQLRSSASASLDSLFLDEGFGTLDSDSLVDVIDALEGLRSEERLVGIITHLSDLAQRIETRIEVTKSPEGSSLRIVGV
jgi:exonuclease SbcC